MTIPLKTFRGTLTEEQLTSLITYIDKLNLGELPAPLAFALAFLSDAGLWDTYDG